MPKYIEFQKMYADSPALFGANLEMGLVSCSSSDDGRVTTWWRSDDRIEERDEQFSPFIWIDDSSLSEGFSGHIEIKELEGEQPFRFLVRLDNFEDAVRFSRHVADKSGIKANAPDSPQIFINDFECQFLMDRGYTYYKGISWEDLRQLWIYPVCSSGPFCYLRESMEEPLYLVAIVRSDGSRELLSQSNFPDERALLKRLTTLIQEYDPDVIAGHKLYDEIMPYLKNRYKRYRLKMAWGRGESIPTDRAVNQKIAEKTVSYRRCDMRGRELVDSWLMAQLYDVSARQMDSYDLLDVARELLEETSLIDELEIGGDKGPEAWKQQAIDLANLSAEVMRSLSQSYFLQAQIFPYTYQNVMIRGNATRINSLFLREYLRLGRSIPARPVPIKFAGGLTVQETCGLAHEVYHCDVQSLYPSVILHYQIKPCGDSLNLFLNTLVQLREFRLSAKDRARSAHRDGDDKVYRHYHALQTVFKVLINSFYGYLGFEQGNFADFSAAAKVTAQGREILQAMMAWLKGRGCTIVEVDTDGIYFMTPSELRSEEERQRLISELNDTLPESINLEFDGHYRSMYCHKMKNYALLDYQDNITLRGSALRSRNMEPFLRDALGKMLYLVLHDREEEIPNLLSDISDNLQAGKIPLSQLAKTDTLISSLESYAKKIGDGKRNRAAAYELALKSGRTYKAGDKVTYYVTGAKANVSVWQNAKLLCEGGEEYDANTKYYLAKLKELTKKFEFAKF